MRGLRLFSAVLIALFAANTLSAQNEIKYYFSKTVDGTFDGVTQKLKAELKKQGFGVITEIDMDGKLKEKLGDVNIMPYRILGVCNPGFAFKTIQVEENIGLFLPCKVLVKDMGRGKIEVVMVDPSVLMSMLGKEDLVKIAEAVTKKFRVALNNM
jgi:uncharacterized protein (DUF302 family)